MVRKIRKTLRKISNWDAHQKSVGIISMKPNIRRKKTGVKKGSWLKLLQEYD